MGHTASTPQLTPFTSPSSLVVSHKHAVTEEEAHKLLLLEVLFKSIDDKSQQWVDRQTITDWVRMEPYLQRDDTRPEAQRMLNKLSHDEDSSRCTYREFVLAFIAFTTDEVRALVINLLRSASSDRPSVLDHLTAGESERAAGYTDVHDEKDSRTLFLLNSIFDAMDVDGVDHVTAAQLHHWLDSDPFFDQPEQADLRQTINQLTHRHYAEGASSPSSSSSPPLPRHVFLSTLSSLARRHVKLLLIHLLRRTTAHVVKAAKLQRKRSIVAHHRVSMSSGSLPSMASLTSSPSHPDPFDENPALQREAEDGERAEQDEAMSVLPSHHLLRRHSILIGGYKRRSTMDGLRLTLLGQSMIQHDLRETDRGRDCLSSLRASLFGDVIFSELESAILTEDMQATPTRNTVFFHAARPSVIDCLQELNVNLLGLSNNHTGDLGPEGVYTLIKEMDARGLVYAGIGANLAQAASPRYLDTANGRIGLVSFASKVPIGSDATADRPGVNHVLMADVDSQKLNKADVRRVVDAVVDARSEADVVVAYHHNHYWEKSNVNEESRMGSWKRKFAHKLIDAGANIYVGHGEPRLQGIEIYRGCVIFYCLGSLFFQTKTEVGFYGGEVWESVIVQVHCHRGEDEEGEEGGRRGKGGRRRRRADDGEMEAKDGRMLAEEKAQGGADGDDGNEDREEEGEGWDSGWVSSYSVKLIPIALNEVGDGFDSGHEHIVKGRPSSSLTPLSSHSCCKGNVVQETQSQHDAELVATRSRPTSPSHHTPTLPISPLVLPAPSTLGSPSNTAPPVLSSSSPLPPPASASYGTVPAFLSPPSFSLSASSLRGRESSLSSSLSPTKGAYLPASSTPPVASYVPPLSPSPHTISSSYALHLSTRGLPRLAPREQAVAILTKIQKMSEEWGTVIDIDEGGGGEDGGVVGWVSTSREAELQHPFLRPRTKKANKEASKAGTDVHLHAAVQTAMKEPVIVSSD